MISSQNYSVFVVHYTKLENRKVHLSDYFEKYNVKSEWITEKIATYLKALLLVKKRLWEYLLKF